MTSITITGDTTQEILGDILYHCLLKYGKDAIIHISKNLRFENQNKEIEVLKEKIKKLEDKEKLRITKKD